VELWILVAWEKVQWVKLWAVQWVKLWAVQWVVQWLELWLETQVV
jgi:hypothetical protein